ncbi:MAG: response regulator [Actinomycetes bacterium]|jgi:DNA-binding LytR/AlgR family response regulator|nr:response regulator [Actinomycetes bacterium]
MNKPGRIRAIIVDDEIGARSELGFMLDDTEQVDVVGEATNVRDAIALIKTVSADVAFLDVNMPGVTGLQLARGLKSHPSPPAVVFVTAYSEFAVKAFELDALDYLMKPVEMKRLLATLDKVRQQMASTAQLDDGSAAAVNGDARKNDEILRVMVTKGNKKVFIPASDIMLIMAKDDYSCIVTDVCEYLSTSSLTKLEAQIEGSSILRVHRRFLVNMTRVSSASPQSGGTLSLTVNGFPESIPVSRRRVPAVKVALNI